MDNYSAYGYIEDCKDLLIDEIKNGNVKNNEELYSIVDEFIDNACIYYKNCIDIINDLRLYDWSDWGEDINSITTLAWIGLRDYIDQECFDYDELKNSIDED